MKLFLSLGVVEKLSLVVSGLGVVYIFELSREESLAESELVFGLVGKVLQLFNALLLQYFIPILVVANPFEELHEVDVITDLLGFVENGFAVVAVLPVDFADVVFDVVGSDGEDALLFLEFFEVVGD